MDHIRPPVMAMPIGDRHRPCNSARHGRGAADVDNKTIWKTSVPPLPVFWAAPRSTG